MNAPPSLDANISDAEVICRKKCNLIWYYMCVQIPVIYQGLVEKTISPEMNICLTPLANVFHKGRRWGCVVFSNFVLNTLQKLRNLTSPFSGHSYSLFGFFYFLIFFILWFIHTSFNHTHLCIYFCSICALNNGELYIQGRPTTTCAVLLLLWMPISLRTQY